eukprot:scaffold248481_cov53-Cyclotella_meneghiniana.AAC.5
MSNQTAVPATPVHRPPTPSAPPSASAPAATPVESNIPFDVEQTRRDMKLCSDCVWEVEERRPHQYKIGELLFNPNKPNSIIAVYPTGSGKSHVHKNRKYWVEWIFDRPHGQIKKRQMDALMLTLIASEIVQLQRDSSGNFKWDLGWVDVSTPLFLSDNVWVAINLFEEDRVRTRIVTVADNN